MPRNDHAHIHGPVLPQPVSAPQDKHGTGKEVYSQKIQQDAQMFMHKEVWKMKIRNTTGKRSLFVGVQVHGLIQKQNRAGTIPKKKDWYS